MRESIGGAWLFGIVITFIFLFSGFLAYSISYTKAFNVKNEVINLIEQNMGLSGYNKDMSGSLSENDKKTVHYKIFQLINNIGYNSETSSQIPCVEGNMKGTNLGNMGVCVIKYCTIGKELNGGTVTNESARRLTNVHYKVTTYISLKVPVIESVIKIPISGETSTIYTDNTNFPCGDEDNPNF